MPPITRMTAIEQPFAACGKLTSERARLLLAPSLLSEVELNYLATGTLPGNDATN